MRQAVVLFAIGIVSAGENFYDCNKKDPQTGSFYINEGHPCCRYGDTASTCYNIDSIYMERSVPAEQAIKSDYIGKTFYTSKDIEDVRYMEPLTKVTVINVELSKTWIKGGEQKWPTAIYYSTKLASPKDTFDLECKADPIFRCEYLITQSVYDSIKIAEKKSQLETKKQNEKRNAARKAAEESKKEQFRKLVDSKNWPNDIRESVLNHKIKIGMNKEQVKLSWGAPDDIHRTISKTLVHEQWVYGRQFLYFNDDVLETMQD